MSQGRCCRRFLRGSRGRRRGRAKSKTGKSERIRQSDLIEISSFAAFIRFFFEIGGAAATEQGKKTNGDKRERRSSRGSSSNSHKLVCNPPSSFAPSPSFPFFASCFFFFPSEFSFSSSCCLLLPSAQFASLLTFRRLSRSPPEPFFQRRSKQTSKHCFFSSFLLNLSSHYTGTA